jgi:hypothetical protein
MVAVGGQGPRAHRTKTKYRDLSTAQRTIRLSAASVEMTFLRKVERTFLRTVEMTFSRKVERTFLRTVEMTFSRMVEMTLLRTGLRSLNMPKRASRSRRS